MKSLRDIPVGPNGAYWVTPWIDVDVPAGLVNFQIVAEGSPEAPVQVADLIDPQGLVYVVSDSNPETLSPYSQPILKNVTSPNRSEAVMPGTGSLIVPNTPHLPAPAAGKWRLRLLFRHEPIQKTVTLWFKWNPLALALTHSAVNVKLWVAPESYWTRQSLTPLLKKAAETLAEAGLNLNISSIEYLKHAITEPMKLPGDIATLARATNDPSVINVYLLPQMEFQNKPINGLACLGGPVEWPVAHGCSASLYANDSAGTISVEKQAKIFVHELGHYLGLFHTTDSGYMLIGTMHDPFADTAEEITGANIMDPGIHDEAPHFSPLQKAFLQNSPALSGAAAMVSAF